MEWLQLRVNLLFKNMFRSWKVYLFIRMGCFMWLFRMPLSHIEVLITTDRNPPLWTCGTSDHMMAFISRLALRIPEVLNRLPALSMADSNGFNVSHSKFVAHQETVRKAALVPSLLKKNDNFCVCL